MRGRVSYDDVNKEERNVRSRGSLACQVCYENKSEKNEINENSNNCTLLMNDFPAQHSGFSVTDVVGIVVITF